MRELSVKSHKSTYLVGLLVGESVVFTVSDKPYCGECVPCRHLRMGMIAGGQAKLPESTYHHRHHRHDKNKTGPRNKQTHYALPQPSGVVGNAQAFAYRNLSVLVRFSKFIHRAYSLVMHIGS